MNRTAVAVAAILCILVSLPGAGFASGSADIPTLTGITGESFAAYHLADVKTDPEPYYYWYMDITSDTVSDFLDDLQYMGYEMYSHNWEDGQDYFFSFRKKDEDIRITLSWNRFGAAFVTYSQMPDEYKGARPCPVSEFAAGYDGYIALMKNAAKSSVQGCAACGGSGVCPVCNGKKEYYVTGYGVTAGTYIACSGCNGTGKCWKCHGTGR